MVWWSDIAFDGLRITTTLIAVFGVYGTVLFLVYLSKNYGDILRQEW